MVYHSIDVKHSLAARDSRDSRVNPKNSNDQILFHPVANHHGLLGESRRNNHRDYHQAIADDCRGGCAGNG